MERANYVTRRLIWALGVSVAVGLLASVARAAISIQMVTVGDPGNVAEYSGDPNYGTQRLCGAVPHVYQIGKFEVTNTQYRAFLNSVARYGDPYNLWGLSGTTRGITRSGSGTMGDPYVYGPKNDDPNWENRPITYVSWYSSLRFINWLQNGQPVAEAGPGVTETGTYTFSDPSTVSIPDHSALTTWHYALPTEDEWYKAAYYKGGGTAAGYWDYATQSDELPNNNPPWEDTGNSANYAYVDLVDPNNSSYAVGEPYWVTDMGAYSLSESAYGTYDQNGNVFEILEDIGPYGGPARALRDSSWGHGQYSLPAYSRSGDIGPDMVGSQSGFRVALVPEPSCVLVLAGGSLLLLVPRKGNSQLRCSPRS